jgi:3-oxoacyl-[acyl-carrier protein] reductase
MGDANLAGNVAVVSGAGRGIGRAIAKAYGAAGAEVFLLARSHGEIEDAATEITAGGGKAVALACDVADRATLTNVMAEIGSHAGGIDIMVINAGINVEPGPVAEGDPDKWAQVINVNVIAAYNQARLAIPQLQAKGGGKILFMGSGRGRRPAPGGSAYAVSKAGLAMLNRTLALELRSSKIAVNEIIPGPVMTAMTGAPSEGVVGEGADSAAELETIRARFPQSEWLKTPGDIVPLALYLAGLPNDGPSGQSFSLMGRDM